MRQTILAAAAFVAVAVGGQAVWAQQDAPAVPGSNTTADHSKFEILKQDFKSGPEVTKACLSCHTEAGDQVMHTLHWSWDYAHPQTGQILGKKNVINAFCGNVAGNETRCTSCHAGYGWEDVRQPAPTDPTRVDCLACHASTELYAKQDNLAGNPPLDPVAKGAMTITGVPAWPVNLSKAAMSVGAPQRENCGQCHYYGGGGDNVKHGDLSSALNHPTRAVDVHMAQDGLNFTCETCHVSEQHKVAGSRYSVNAHDEGDTGMPGMRRDVATCESCHTDTPHKATLIGMKLNDHTDRVACQTCHIPEFARGGVATKTMWDWSTAGKLKDGKPYHESTFTQSNGKELHTYLSTKGDFKWEENVVPYYAWFNGQVEYVTKLETIDPTKVVEVNRISGTPADGTSRIWPFKRMEGRQAYDSKLNKLVYNHVYGPTTDSAFWTNFDWGKSIKAAMEYVGEPYSGEYGFVDTYMYWPITHMVAPKDAALECDACHAKDGRLSAISAGIYMPGTGLPLGGKLGLAMLALVALGVAVHGGLRVFGRKGGHHG